MIAVFKNTVRAPSVFVIQPPPPPPTRGGDPFVPPPVGGGAGGGGGWITKTDGALTVFLNTAITPELQKEGLARELIRLINDARKKSGLTPADTVEVLISTADPIIHTVIKEFQKQLRKAVIAKSVKIIKKPQEIQWSHEVKIDESIRIWIGINKLT